MTMNIHKYACKTNQPIEADSNCFGCRRPVPIITESLKQGMMGKFRKGKQAKGRLDLVALKLENFYVMASKGDKIYYYMENY